MMLKGCDVEASSDYRTLLTFGLPLAYYKLLLSFCVPIMSIHKHFLFSPGPTSMSDASSFRDAMLAKIVLAQY